MALIAIVLAVLAAAATVIMKAWKIGPWLPQNQELDDFSQLPAVTIDHTAPVSPQEPITAPITPKPMLDTFCTAIKQFEGANPANNNPGNCRCSPVGYLPKYGNVTCNPNNFAVFPTYELGWEYLTELVYHRALAHPTWTILDFFENYAPSSDGNQPSHYAQFVAEACNVPVNTDLAKLFG